MTSSDRVLVSAGADDEDPASFTLMMRIQNVITADRGTYYCHANNTLGEASQAVELQVQTRPKDLGSRRDAIVFKRRNQVLKITKCISGH